ncbi:MAG: ABC transporter substrate-binding protein, partial [Bacteroidota bacterium]
ELSQQGIQLKLDVVDTKASEDEIRRLIDGSALSDAHMIVGPVRSSNLKLVGEYARSNFKPLVSPISPSMSAASNNPYYIQVSPSLRAHCDAITRHAKERYRSDQIVLVCRNKKAEINRLRYFQQTNYMIEGSTLADRLTEFIVTDLSADFNEMDVAPYIKEGDTTVFVIPSWSNESFVYSFLRKVNLAKGNNQVVIYGMPQWMRFERISYDYFEQLNVHVSSANYVDQESPGIQRFRRSFFERYHMLPTENAYKGYDVMKFFGQMIHRYGTRFQDVIDQQTFTGANFQYKFERIPESDATPESGANIDHIENTSVDILKFEDYYFQPAY